MSSSWTDDLMPSGAVPAPAAAPPSSGRELPAAVVALVIVVLLAALAVPVSALARGSHAFWPGRWDSRIAPIAARDAEIRGLKYEHPVAVKFLSDQAFVKLIGGRDDDPENGRAEIEREAATFRSLGFIGGKVDLFKVTKQADEAGTLAFYDFNKKEIVVRGTKLDASHRATLSHELTHVLQDQHFDIRSIDQRSAESDERSGASAGAMLALIEGDANNVMRQYLKELPAATRAEYEREQRAQSGSIGKATVGVPPFIELLFSAPYDLGPLTIRVLVAGGGNAAVNDALTGPIPTSADFVQAGLVEPPPGDLPAPSPRAREHAVGKPEAFGAFEMYLTLATRVDPNNALAVADSIEGGRAQGFRKNSPSANSGTYCYRATVKAADGAAAAYLETTLHQWERSATGASVSRVADVVTFTACDPGKKAVAPSAQRITAAEVLLAARAGLTVGAAESGVAPAAARCVARLFVRSPNALSLLTQAGGGSLSPDATATVRSRVQSEAVSCRDDPSTGLR